MIHQQEIDAVQWWHTIELPGGIKTPGRNATASYLPMLHLPEDLRGQTVLDIGTWDGYYAFECERRGGKVLATDSFMWENGTGRAGFDLAHRALHSSIDSMHIDVMHLDPAIGRFDLVLMLGVLYHMKHPLLALERVRTVTRGTLVLETHVDMLTVAGPAMAFYEGTECAGDPTNWCGPNPPAVLAMLRTAGFKDPRVVSGPYPGHKRIVVHAEA